MAAGNGLVSMSFSGGRELEAALRQLPQAVGRSAVQSALKDVATPIVAAMRQGAPKATGEGAASIDAAVTRVVGQAVT
ncbi:MAG: HK97 gp10 family phage protein, partial [Gemmatimonadales bacterium]|nr:HK97 gp10 family phage protein [Gemmatimonadales bacterium]